MKKLALILLTICTFAMAIICGCGSAKTNSFEETAGAESAQVQTLENEQTNPECPECPDDEQDGECPKPRKPHIKRPKRLPDPESAHRKHH